MSFQRNFDEQSADDRFSVWLVEDSPLQAQAIVQAIDSRCSVRRFSSGEEFLEQFTIPTPDLLITDWILPGLSGLEICQFVRTTHDKVALPILMLTSHASEEALAAAFRHGVNDFVLKPFNETELSARVESLVTLRRMAAEISAGVKARSAALVHEAELAANEAKYQISLQDKYIGILGHDLRNPLSAIMVAAQVIGRLDNDVARKGSTRITRSAERMVLMIQDILDFARGRLGEGIPLNLRPANLRSICESVIDELLMTHPDRQIRLSCAGDLEGTCDPNRFEQAISNLVGNALQHSRDAVDIALQGSGEEIAIEIHNGGAPIPPDELAVLFQPFRKRDPNRGGLGLGLYIVRLIAGAHGGTIAAASTAAAGTKFTLTVPRRPVAAVPADGTDAA